MSNSWWCYALYLPGSSVHGIFQQEYLDAISKLTQWSWFISKHTIQHHSNPNLCPNHWSWRSWGWPVLGRCIRPFRTNTKTTATKRHFFHHRGLECKCRKWRDTWSNRQVCLWSTEWSRAKANRILLREHAGYSKCSFPTTQEMTLHMDITKWSATKADSLCSLRPKMEKLQTLSKSRTRTWLWLRSSAPYCKIQAQIVESRGNR